MMNLSNVYHYYSGQMVIPKENFRSNSQKKDDLKTLYQNIVKQNQYSPLSVAEQALTIFAAERGYLEDVELNKVLPFEKALLAFAHSKYDSLLKDIDAKPDYSDEVVAKLTEVVKDFKSTQTY